MIFESYDPYTRQKIAEYQPLSVSEIDLKLKRSQKAFQSWKATDLDYRLQLLENLAKLIESDLDLLSVAMVKEMGKTITEARAEVLKCATGIRFFIKQSPVWLAPEYVDSDARLSMVCHQPLGGIFLVMPWNFPLWQVLRAAVPALCVGNVILLKHAPNVFGYSLLIEDLFKKAGFPEGVFENFLVGVSDIEQITASASVAAISLTGSEGAGRSMASIAGKYLKKCVLELGGSDPFIVMPDADLPFAASMAAKARMINNGQSCIAAKRFLVHETVEKDFTELLIENLKLYVPANPMLPATLLGPQARPDLVANLEVQLSKTLHQGAELLYKMDADFETGYFFLPVLLGHVQPGMSCFDEEVFGPIASVCSFHNQEEVIQLANQTKYGLGASIYTSDETEAQKMALQLECGTVAINAMVRSKPSLPFGGIKASGYGRELSQYGLFEFSNAKTVTVG
jgi:succinate-semialdehyde dehydrogenase/glutarate-semialdehyde dehydrogenase